MQIKNTVVPILGLALAGVSGLTAAQDYQAPSRSYEFANESPWRSSVTAELIGGAFMNDALREHSAGREHQVKMTRALASINAGSNAWRARLELVALGDEVEVSKTDRAYQDVYRNLGTDLYYYGDYPVREAWVGQTFERGYWKFGRMVSLLGQPVERQTYTTAMQAPNAVLFNTGLLNGVRGGFRNQDRSLMMEFGVMGGRDRPCLSGNCYLDGALDVNEKGNNTPVLEAKVSYRPTSYLGFYSGYLRNKTGSAPGSFESGKHNDERLAAGVDIRLMETRSAILDVRAQYNEFLVGLTEEGVQAERTPVESKDIKRKGYFATATVTFPMAGMSVAYTFEEMDRLDARAWQQVAQFDGAHPVVNATESRQIVTVAKDFGYGVSVEAFYKTQDVPYLGGGDAELEDQAGVVLKFSKRVF